MSADATADSPRWLDDDELAAWLGLVHLTLALPTAIDKALRDEAGISHTYYMVLAMLSESPGRAMRMSDLSEVTSTSPSRLSHAVASLERRGWVERRQDSTDRRGQLAVLTDDGMRTLERLAPGHVADVRRLVIDRLTERDLRDLRRIAAKLLADAPALRG
jgi:DNA-binding MarR family transcriptional regulator